MLLCYQCVLRAQKLRRFTGRARLLHRNYDHECLIIYRSYYFSVTFTVPSRSHLACQSESPSSPLDYFFDFFPRVNDLGNLRSQADISRRTILYTEFRTINSFTHRTRVKRWIYTTRVRTVGAYDTIVRRSQTTFPACYELNFILILNYIVFYAWPISARDANGV